MATATTMTGVDQLVKRLDAVRQDVRYKGGRFALRKAAQLVRNNARSRAQAVNDPETGRSIAENIVEKWNGRLFKTTGDLGFRVGVQGGAKLPPGGNPDTGGGGATPHWRLVEFGTEHSAARPFMRPALEASAQAATDEFIQQYGKALDRALKKV